mgnify:CR=1 FL=1
MIALCAVLESGHHLERIVNRIDRSLRLELYLNPRDPDGGPAIFSVFCGMRLRDEDKLPRLSVLKIIHRSLNTEDWLQLLTATDVYNGLPLLGCMRCNEEKPDVLRYILESIDDPADRLALLQAHSNRYDCLAKNFLTDKNLRDVMFECIPIVDLLQTPTQENSITSNDGKITYLPEQNAYVPLAQHYTRRYESTLVHDLLRA